ncbi:KIF-1 binding protein [Kipferlia bialata]|uniref:KIF-binding protein n=1 Tax=Kipferlia bialata TaxID=797122 RepID=A0A9K3CS36_9EUKA|nr:KIF-1 binding protein [Kipferlia bialata]|eukprot:g3349.t1
MEEPKEYMRLRGVFDTFQRVQSLVLTADPPETPYTSKYQARELLGQMVAETQALTLTMGTGAGAEGEGEGTPDTTVLKDFVAYLHHLIGVLAYETEETSAAVTHLSQSLAWLGPRLQVDTAALGHPPADADADAESEADSLPVALVSEALSPGVSLALAQLLVRSLNQMGVVWTNRQDPTRGMHYLKAAEALYRTHVMPHIEALKSGALGVRTVPPCGTEPVPTDTDTGSEGADTPAGSDCQDGWWLPPICPQWIESLHTYTVFFLAQVYSALGEASLAAEYCRTTLDRQSAQGGVDVSEWVSNAVDLVAYYEGQGQLGSVRHLLSQARAMLDSPSASLDTDAEDHKELIAKLNVAEGNLYSGVIAASRNTLTRWEDACHEARAAGEAVPVRPRAFVSMDVDVAPDPAETREGTDADADADTDADTADVALPPMDTDTSDGAEDEMPLLSRSQAYELFNKAYAHYQQALDVFKLEGFVTGHVAVLFRVCDAYLALSSFEPQASMQARLHRRRELLLSRVLPQLNPQHYLVLMREMHFRVAHAQMDLFDIKQERVQSLCEAIEMAANPEALIAQLPQGEREAYSKALKVGLMSLQSLRLFHKTYEQEVRRRLQRDDASYSHGLPEGVDDVIELLDGPEDVAGYLQGLFDLGRVQFRLPVIDSDRRIVFLEDAVQCFARVVKYGGQVTTQAMAQQRNLCKEMLRLLTAKVHQLKRIRMQSRSLSLVAAGTEEEGGTVAQDGDVDVSGSEPVTNADSVADSPETDTSAHGDSGLDAQD